MVRNIKTYLICRWATQSQCGTPTDCIQISGAGQPDANGLYVLSPSPPGNIYINGVNDYYIVRGTPESGSYLADGDGNIQYLTDTIFPCNWVVSDIGFPPAPTGEYIACPCGQALDCLQISGASDGLLNRIFLKSSTINWISIDKTSTIELSGGVWQVFRLPLHTVRFTLDTGQPFPCGTWTPDVFHPGQTIGTVAYVQCPNYILQDTNGFFWRIIVDIAGNLGTQSDPGPATPDIILDDGTATYWKLIVDIGGLLGSQPDPGPPSSTFPLLHDANHALWEIIVDVDGNVGSNSV